MEKNKAPNVDFTETEVSSRVVYKGKLLEHREDEVRLADGSLSMREYVRHPGAVLIIPLPDARSVLLEHQFRYAIGRHCYELPAGKMEPGEEPLATAKRELLEETGYAAGAWAHLTSMYPCVGYSNERIELYLARELSYLGHRRDHGEFLETFELPIADAVVWIERGLITDTKTIMGVFWAEKIARGDFAA